MSKKQTSDSGPRAPGSEKSRVFHTVITTEQARDEICQQNETVISALLDDPPEKASYQSGVSYSVDMVRRTSRQSAAFAALQESPERTYVTLGPCSAQDAAGACEGHDHEDGVLEKLEKLRGHLKTADETIVGLRRQVERLVADRERSDVDVLVQVQHEEADDL